MKLCIAWRATAAKVSLPVRGAWVEISSPNASLEIHLSLPVRGAWVEIATRGLHL